MPMNSSRPLLAILCLLASGGLAQAETTAVPGYSPLPLDDNDEILAEAVEVGQLFEDRGLLFKHASLESQLQHVAQQLRLPAPDGYIDYRFFLINDPSPHAFSLVDGQIYLHTGLVARLESLEQLAAVVAHEAHHVAAHDHIDAARDKSSSEKGRNIGLYILDVAALGGAATTFSSAAAVRAHGRFDLEHEVDADRGAANILSQAGLDEAAIAQVLERIAPDLELAAARMPGVFSADGQVDERIARFGEIEVRQSAGITIFDNAAAASFQQVVDELRRKTIDDYIRANAPRMAAAYARRLIEDEADAHAYAALGDALYALGPHPDTPPPLPAAKEVRRLSKMTREEIDAEILATADGRANQQRHFEEAMEAYSQALVLDPDEANAHRGMGRLLYHEGRYREAAASLIRYLKLRPEALDRPIVIQKLQDIRNTLSHVEENAS